MTTIIDKTQSYEFTTPDGARWQIPLTVLAEKYTALFADSEEETWKEWDEYPQTPVDFANDELRWEEVQEHITRVSGPITLTSEHMRRFWRNDAREGKLAPTLPPHVSEVDRLRALLERALVYVAGTTGDIDKYGPVMPKTILEAWQIGDISAHEDPRQETDSLFIATLKDGGDFMALPGRTSEALELWRAIRAELGEK